MPNTTGDDEGDGAPPSSASQTIAALWQEREEQLAALRPAPPTSSRGARTARVGRTARRSNDRRGPRRWRRPSPCPRRPPGRDSVWGRWPRWWRGRSSSQAASATSSSAGAAHRRGATFIAKADAVCRPADALLSVTRPTSYPELATAAGTLATAAEGELGQLRQISRPAGSAGNQAGTVVNDLAATTDAAKGLHVAAEQKDDAATVAAANKLSAASATAAGTAGVYGMAACGSGLQPSVQTLTLGTRSVIKAGFSAKADAMCRTAADDLDGLGEPNFDDPGELVAYLEAALVIQVRLGDQLRALPVPPGDETIVTEMLAAYDKVTAKARALTNAVANLDESGFIIANREITTLGTTADAKLDGYGLAVCGSNFGNI